MASRQAEWQKRMRAENRCSVCGGAEYVKGYCLEHYEKRMRRLKDQIETETQQPMKEQKCSYCSQRGHNRRGCPVRKVAETPIRPTS